MYRYEKFELLIWINQIINKYQYVYMYLDLKQLFCVSS